MRLRKKTLYALLLGLLVGPATLACQTDGGLFDRDEGAVEEIGEELDEGFDRDRN